MADIKRFLFGSIAKKINVMVFFSIILTSSLIYFSLTQVLDKTVKEHSLEKFLESERVFYSSISEKTEMLSSSLEVFIRDKRMQEAYMEGNRSRLHNASLPYLNLLEMGYEVTHFYYILPNGTIFLRVHEPEKY